MRVGLSWLGVPAGQLRSNVDVRAVKPRKPKSGESLACATAELVRGAVAETLKYATKPSDMVADPEWFLELTRQTHKRRFVATGGALKDVLKLEQETDQDMVIGDDIAEGDDDGSRIAFSETEVKKYRRSPTKIKPNQGNGVSGLRLTRGFVLLPSCGGNTKHIIPFLMILNLKNTAHRGGIFSRVSHLWGETTKRAFENSKDTTTKPLHRSGDRKTNSTDAK